MTYDQSSAADSSGLSRRTFLADTGMGFTGLALGAMLHDDASAETKARTTRIESDPHFPAQADSVIWIFLTGGVSHMESFDIKPALNKYDGKTFEETPFAAFLDKERREKNLAGQGSVVPPRKNLMGLQSGYHAYGDCGLEVSDWFSNIGECADDLAVVRSLWTVHPNHGMQLTWHTGHHVREGARPTVGSWVSYGLGSRNQQLPKFVVMGHSIGGCCGGEFAHGASYLGPHHAGVKLSTDPANPLPFVSPFGQGVTAEEQEAELDLIGKLNRAVGVEYPDDPQLRARIRSYELAAGMQTAVPDIMDFETETQATQSLYGLDQEHSREFGTQCLAARRLVEKGVRFVQLYHGAGSAGKWDAHNEIKKRYDREAPKVDQPIAGLLKDLKRRGMLERTLVVFGTEFGRTPGAQGNGRDHHPQGFTCWLAGGGIKGGVTHGATDELGFYAVENRHYVTDIHATVLYQLGLDPLQLEVPGRKRIDLHRGSPIHEIIA
ncbi:MAG TPA: DUF1501 domain-containing protein [Planctomycetaceae bacterium]|nr:sulfatase [Planctomycetaceae bacterium]MCH2587993.1 DUF1501 domain-containing protein [Planctomycetales bacterium]HAA59900.1 DUF1501 domain-containing protein [Planctomycetaceae bacterium]|tara:strand:- start:2958 stop:4436 length:1479 start_codon:yes stop_codon:yes gene_type:complete